MANGVFKLSWYDGREVHLNLAQVVNVEGKPGDTWWVFMTANTWAERNYYQINESTARQLVSRLQEG